jgi:hypothetical protein
MQDTKFFIHLLGSRKVYQKEKKKWGLSFKKMLITAQKPMTLFKRTARHRMVFFEIKATCPSDVLKHIT